MSALPSGPRGFLRVNWQLMRDPIGTALRWRSQYGDPMTYPDLEGKPCLVVGSPEGISSLLSAPLEATEQALVERLSAFLGESSVLTISGPRHAAMRKLLTPPFHGQRMRVYGKQICDLTMDHARKLPPGLKFKPLDFINGIGLEVIVRLIFGVTAPERVALVEALVADMRKAFPRAIIPMLIPWLRRELWGFGPWARMQATLRAVSGFLKEEIANHRAHPTEQSDILSLLIAARHEDGSGLTDQEIIDQLHTLLFAGHSTTAMALNWALYFLLKEPQSLARLRKELTELGSNPSPELLAKAPFLEAVCHETLRLRSPLGGIGRKLRTPLTVAGVPLPAGSTIIVNILWAHFHHDTYPQPEQFSPERFLTRSYSPFEFLPFGGGNRRCIGAAFALYEMKLVLATLLLHVDFELLTTQPIRVVQREFLQPHVPLEMVPHPRTDTAVRHHDTLRS
jgi:cytochrome P450